MPHITIQTTAMGFRVRVSSKGIIIGTQVPIIPYARKFEHWEYDRHDGVWNEVNTYYRYYKDIETMFFPKYDLPVFQAYLRDNGITYTVENLAPAEGVSTNFMMLPHIEYKNKKQEGAVNYLTNPESGPLRGLALQTGAGKAQPLSAGILTPRGWETMGDMVPGKTVIAPDGTTTTITGVFPQGKKDIYRIVFEDGRSTECCDEHLWDVFHIQWADRWRTVSLNEIRSLLEKPAYKNRLYIQLPEPTFKEDVDLPIDPYLLGVLLGDGSFGPSSVRLSTPDSFILDEVSRLLPDSLRVVHVDRVNYQITRKSLEGPRRSEIVDIIRELGLSETRSDTKFIPEIYMNASPAQKLALIQGLMDTDGTVDKNTGASSFCTTSRIMGIQVQDIIRSLGGMVKISERFPRYTYKGEVKVGKVALQLNIRFKDPRQLFRLPRKKELTPENYQYKDSFRLRIKEVFKTGRKDAQCIMVDHPDHLYVTDQYVVTHNTVSYIWAIEKLAKRSMTLMTSRLEQWVGEFCKYTTLEEDDIYVISGNGSLSKLFAQIDKNISPKSILASAQTIRKYLEYGPGYQHLPHPSTMCEALGIGVVGTDEFHEHFHTNFSIGITLNPEIFIPITATFTVNDAYAKSVFDQFVPESIQFEGGEYDKYTNVTAYTYRAGSTFIKPFHYMSRNGYSQVMFENSLTTKKAKPFFDHMLNDAILPIIREHYIDIAADGEKLLVLCATQNLCEILASEFKRRFNSKKVSTFFSGMPVHTLEKFDIIVSTPGSAGTGRDIKNLRTCFAFENSASENRNLQFLGRLRDFPAVKNTPEFTYLSFSCIPQHVTYATKRAMLYGPRAKTFKQRTI